VSAYSDLITAVAEHPFCFSEDDAKKLVDAHRDEVALQIGRDVLRDGLVSTLVRLVGEENATKMLADHRGAIAQELAEQQRAHAQAENGEPGCWHDGAHPMADLIDPTKDVRR
jgi:hypothetical protein